MNDLDTIIQKENLELFKNTLLNEPIDVDYTLIRSSMYDSLNIFKYLISHINVNNLNKNTLTLSLHENGTFCFSKQEFKITKWLLSDDKLKYKIDILKGNLKIFNLLGYNGEVSLLRIILNNNYSKLEGKTKEAAIFNTISSCAYHFYNQKNAFIKESLLQSYYQFLEIYFEQKCSPEKVEVFLEQEAMFEFKNKFSEIRHSYFEKEKLNTVLSSKFENKKLIKI